MTHPGGRPTDYSPDMVIKTREYIASCQDKIEEYHKTRGDKSDSYDRIVRVKLPTLEGLAVHLGINRDTIYAWRKVHQEFSDVIDELLAKQAQELINNGLSGDYNPTIAKVLLSKHGYTEKTETDITTAGEKITQLTPEQIAAINKIALDE